ncbi:MAG TPA: PAS domain S-box protein [Patescibacteria group bacterium]|nr:PAS domain S-box protein [Patescibacteria group bacterium]
MPQLPEALYKEFFASSPVGFGISDADGVLLDFNDAMRAYGGWGREEVLAIGNVTELYYDGPAERERLLGIARAKGKIVREEVRFKSRDGGFYWAAMSLRHVTIEGKTYWLAVVEDITAAKKAHAERERQMRELEDMAKLMAGRESKMIELKEKIRKLEEGAP